MTFAAYHSQPSTQAFSPYRAPLVRVNRKRPCPVCGKPDNCSVREDGSAAYCRRSTHGDKQGRDGGFLHVLRFDDFTPTATPQPQVAPSPTPTPERANAERCHAVYSELRMHLVLSKQHRNVLRTRGLTDVAIELAEYRSVPTPAFAMNVARALARSHDLAHVPGFYRSSDDAWRMVDAGIGIFIPVLNFDGRIEGFQIRRDEGTPKYLWFSSAGRKRGASSGAPVHFAKSHLLKDADEVTITEGALKASIAAHLLNAPVIGFAGCSAFGAAFAANLKERFPKLRRVAVAFDMDMWQKPQVAAALDKLITQLEKACFTVRVRTWDASLKGIDDFLVAQLGGQEVAK